MKVAQALINDFSMVSFEDAHKYLIPEDQIDDMKYVVTETQIQKFVDAITETVVNMCATELDEIQWHVDNGTQKPYKNAVDLAQQIRRKFLVDDWISVDDRLPSDGDFIEGKSKDGTWTETWDSDEPLGLMTHWRLVEQEQ